MVTFLLSFSLTDILVRACRKVKKEGWLAKNAPTSNQKKCQKEERKMFNPIFSMTWQKLGLACYRHKENNLAGRGNAKLGACRRGVLCFDLQLIRRGEVRRKPLWGFQWKIKLNGPKSPGFLVL